MHRYFCKLLLSPGKHEEESVIQYFMVKKT